MPYSSALCRIPARFVRRLPACLLLLVAAAPLAHAEDEHAQALAGLYRVVKRFDFDERKLGNYDQHPMYWRKLVGPGLPFFNSGAFSTTVGDSAPPSFELGVVAGGSVAYEYDRNDLIAVGGSDYVINAKIRAVGLTHSRAFVVAYFADRFGREVPGSKRVSALVGATGRNPEPFQPVRIDLPGDYSTAFSLRLQLWILQGHVWRETPADAVDPILAHDVRGSAQFDDLAIYRLPRTRIRLEGRGAVITEDEPATLLIDVHNATPYPMTARVRITDQDGAEKDTQLVELPAETDRHSGSRAATTLRSPLPPLKTGLHEATLDVLADGEVVLRRVLRFVVARPLPKANAAGTLDMGIDIGPWHSAEPDELLLLLDTLRAGSVKLGVPMLADLNSPGTLEHFGALDEFLRRLADARMSPVGVMLTPETLFEPESAPPLHSLISARSDWQRQTGPTLARFGGTIPIWQLGSEALELRGGRTWGSSERRSIREHLPRFTSLPQLVVPEDVFQPLSPEGPDVASLYLDPLIPTRDIPRQIAEISAESEREIWVAPAFDPEQLAPGSQSIADYARRLILSRAARAARWFAPAPFAPSLESGEVAWRPTRRFLPLRTLNSYLGGRIATAVLTPRPDVIGLVFEGRGMSVLALWTWADRPSDALDLYLGPEPQAVDLLGRPVPLEVLSSGHARVVAQPEPTLIYDVDARLARTCASVTVEPARIQSHAEGDAPSLRLKNHFDQHLTGEITLQPPPGWEVQPEQWRVELKPGEELVQELRFQLPPRELAGARTLGVVLALQGPRAARLRFARDLQVGLSDIGMDVSVEWRDDVLVVLQTLINESAARVSFSAFCDAPERAREEAAFLGVPNGERRTQRYEIPAAAAIPGTHLFLGVRELGGSRRIQQLVEIPAR